MTFNLEQDKLGEWFVLYQTCHFAHIWLVQFQFEISDSEHKLPRSRLAVECKLLRQWTQLKAKPLSWYLKPRIGETKLKLTWLSSKSGFMEQAPGVSSPALGGLPSYRFQPQPQSNTPEPANHCVQGYMFISDRCVGAGLELKSAGR